MSDESYTSQALDIQRVDAFLLDLDGVITRTAAVHARAWKQLFDAFLQNRSRQTGLAFQPFDISTDYPTYVDGKSRHDGILSFLASRGINLAEGKPDDAAGEESVYALGRAKQTYFLSLIQREGVEVYATSVAFMQQLQSLALKVAIVTSSKNGRVILDAAGIDDCFQVLVDGNDRERLGLPGKPAPDLFLEAAARLGVTSSRAVVVEDSIAGVQAGRAGQFAYVIGVDRAHQASILKRNGADIVVHDLSELILLEGDKV